MELRSTQTFCLLLSLLFASVAADLHSPEVHTELGSLKGQYVTVKGTEAGVHAFLGVPFAKQPVGPSLRLAAPQPVEGWKGVRDATKQPAMCIQSREIVLDLLDKLGGLSAEIPEVSEDCLYLNIYTPAKKPQNAKLPVMVWIHGGGFTLGSASIYDGSALAAYQDVVVVLIQYRLGLLGFLSTGDEHVSGNFGLLDQVEALKWIQQHIHNFGGNPDLVTIFGESAGGVSVSLLLLSPLADGLFHQAIAESGTAAMDMIVSNDPLPMTKVIANLTGCSSESTERFGECIRHLDIDPIISLAKDPAVRYIINVDGHFLRKPVDELFRNHELQTVPFMTGVTNDEGGFLVPSFLFPSNWTEGLDRDLVVNVMSLFFPDEKAAVVLKQLIEEYIGTGEDQIRNRDGFTEMFGDIIFNIPVVKTVNAHRDAGAAVYLYEYQHPPKALRDKRPSFVKSDHGDEILMVFGLCFTTTHVTLQVECPEEEEQLSRTIMSYWANFARTGSPNGDGLAHWPKYGAEEQYLAIGLKEQVVADHLKKDRFVFMTETFPEKIKQLQEKHAPEVHTELGSLKGQYVTVKGTEAGVHAFLGVPFAKPPVGPSLRLAAPQPVEGWKGVRDATKQPAMCIQSREIVLDLLDKLGGLAAKIPEVSEDCLYLNIYTPAEKPQNAKLPVMVWIHGGGFTMGSASMYDGSALAAYQDVVVVLIQYRLGLLGFLSTGDEHVSGNYGLLDQVEALKWIQQHIHNFGGNPDLVTIFGESAGGVSVSLLLLSPLSDGLFHRAIAQSGTAAMDSLVSNNPLPVTKVVANLTGCSLETTKKFSECMRHLDIDPIIALAEDRTLTASVTVDGHFLRKPVDELFHKHELQTVPFMTGVTNDEGGYALPSYLAPSDWTEGIDRELFVNLMSIFLPDKNAVLQELLTEEYIGTGEDRVKNRDGLTNLLGDLIFYVSGIKTANAHRDAGAAVYLYEYQHPLKMVQKRRPSFVKCDHADDILTVFGLCFTTAHVTLQETCPKEEEQLTRTVMSYWANFARTGSPNGDGLAHWPKYGAEEQHLVIGLKEQVVAHHLKKDRFVFMTQILPEKIKQRQERTEHSEL
uniref:Liver carboxylesterase 2-like n=2 Tax=Salarias fasciatus TaxID=181472 RepID=A0A672GAB7_SALFA